MSEKRLLIDELHAPARRNFPRRHVVVHGYDDHDRWMWSRYVLICDSTKVTYILIVIAE